jgi:hypothetical protein
MNSYKIYDHADFCPIWNHEKVKETGDLRYLLKLESYSKLPDIEIIDRDITYHKRLWLFNSKKEKTVVNIYNYTEKDLASAWENVNYTIDSDLLELGFPLLRQKCWIAFNGWKSGAPEKEYNTYFAQLRMKADNLYYNFKIGARAVQSMAEYSLPWITIFKMSDLYDQTFRKFNDVYHAMKERLSYDELLNVRLIIFDAIDCDFDKEQSISKEVTAIERELGINIDIHKCSVNKYYAYRKQMIDIINKRKEKK